MSGNRKWTTAAVAAGVVALAALIGCGGEKSVASKSAAAFEEARKEGKTFEGAGHEHGGDHGGHEMPDAADAADPADAVDPADTADAVDPADTADTAPAESGEHRHGTPQADDHSAMGHGAGQPHAEGHAPAPQAAPHAGHGSPAAGQPAAAGHEAHDHAGHSQPAAAPEQDHAGHSQTGGTPSAPVAELPTEPASILRPDPLDAPAATSVVDAQRSEEMNREMSGGHEGHGGHGAGTYRQVDAGRGPGAHEGSEPHDHGAALYVCPMHPEVTSKTPGTCPKCGMTLVERREE